MFCLPHSFRRERFLITENDSVPEGRAFISFLKSILHSGLLIEISQLRLACVYANPLPGVCYKLLLQNVQSEVSFDVISRIKYIFLYDWCYCLIHIKKALGLKVSKNLLNDHKWYKQYCSVYHFPGPPWSHSEDTRFVAGYKLITPFILWDISMVHKLHIPFFIHIIKHPCEAFANPTEAFISPFEACSKYLVH